MKQNEDKADLVQQDIKNWIQKFIDHYSGKEHVKRLGNWINK